jgi:Domain of unknown function (DUF397)
MARFSKGLAPAAGMIVIRDSTDPPSALLQYPGAAWRAFLGTVKRVDSIWSVSDFTVMLVYRRRAGSRSKR